MPLEIDFSKTFNLEPLIQTVPEEQRRLGLFIFIAALAHFVAFAFIEISYIEPLFSPPEKFHMTYNFEDRKNSRSQNAQFWDEWLDPSTLILDQEPLLKEIGQPAPPPSVFESKRIFDAPLAEENPPFHYFPDQLPPIAERLKNSLNPSLQVFSYPDLSPVETSPTTTIQFEFSLKNRIKAPLPQLPNPAAASLTEAGVTVLALAVDSRGNVANVLVQQSCGQPNLDRLAADELRHYPFQSVEGDSLLWSNATVFWHFEAAKNPSAKVENAP